MVEEKVVDGWNDPRLLTLEGLRKRGYTPSMINDFCAHLGVARKGNECLTKYVLLENFARNECDRLAPRTFGVTDPILLEIQNLEVLGDKTKFEAKLFPADATQERGTQTYTLTKNVYIEKEDFSEEHIDKFFGLTPNQPVCLKYGPVVKLVGIEKNEDGSISHAKVEIIPDFKEKLKGFIHWVSKEHSMPVTLNLYAVLFTVEDVKKEGDKWLDFINPNSLVVRKNAKMWNLHKKAKIDDRFQFERAGYFVIEESSNPKKGKFVLNRIVELKESKNKVVSTK